MAQYATPIVFSVPDNDEGQRSGRLGRETLRCKPVVATRVEPCATHSTRPGDDARFTEEGALSFPTDAHPSSWKDRRSADPVACSEFRGAFEAAFGSCETEAEGEMTSLCA